MTRRVMIILLLLSGGVEILLTVSTMADLRPRSSAAVEALFAYRNHPDTETRDRWQREFNKMNREVSTKRVVGYSLLIGNRLFAFYLGALLVRRRARTRRTRNSY